jgi:membrane-associated protease RseP (regulator of RpoE activity)
MTGRRRIGIVITIAVAVVLALATSATAQATRATAATTAPAPAPHPNLAALDAECQQLFRHAEARIVRVTVPMPVPVDDFLARFEPKVRAQLKPNAPRLFVQAATTRQAAVQVAPESNLIPLPSVNATLNVEFAGLVLNREGDVLLPLFIDPEFVRGSLMVNVDGRHATTARVVGADRQTALTIVRLAEAAGEPALFQKSRPPHGSVMLMISPTRRAARLGVWTGSGAPDEHAILVNRDGRIAAFVRNGRPLYPATFAPVVDQLLSGGVVRRAQLGVQIMAVRPDDPQRAQLKDLGARPAARVMDVLENSPAARGGLRAGDVILSLANEPVEDIPTFAAALANKSGPTELLILRDGKPHKVVVELKVQ